MTLLELPTELLLLIASFLPQRALAHLLQVHRSLYEVLLPNLYQRHIRDNRLQLGLFWSVATGNEAAVNNFLHYGADVNACIGIIPIRQAKIPFQPWFNVQTPLSIAANIGNDVLVDLLLKHGANVNGFPSPGWGTTQPAVLDALLSGYEGTVRLLLMHKSPMQKPSMELGGLVNCAIAKGEISLLKLLVEFGADLNIPWRGAYPLNRAVSSPNLSTEIVQFLLDNGADIGLANGDPGILLDQAIHGTIGTLCLLLDRGVTYPPDRFEKWFETWVGRCTLETVHLFLEYGYAPNLETLSIVVRAQRRDILQLFINCGADLNMKGTGGLTLLHEAVLRCIPSEPPMRMAGRATVCRRPVKENLVRKIEPDLQRVSPTCMNDNVGEDAPEEIVRCLILGGADLNALDAKGRTPLALAREFRPEIQQILVDGGGI